MLLPLLFTTFLCTCGRAPENDAGKESRQPATLHADANLITIREGRHTATIDLVTGGRLASYTVEGIEVLKTTRDADNLEWGSTVWTSPQSAWNGPPEATFDADAFERTDQNQASVSLQSAVDPATKLQMVKTFAFVTGGKSGLHLQTTYELYNRGNEPVYRALWENTRLPYGGEFSFVADSIRLDKLENNFATRGKATVVPMTAEDTRKGKLFVRPAKGKATYAGNGVRLRKLWFPDDQHDVAPGHAPLEIYLDPKSGLAEFEIQGPYRAIAPGGYTSLAVAWQVAKLTVTD